MSFPEREREARIELVRSIARSQLAVARILESVADAAGRSPELAAAIGANIRSLAAMQDALTETAGGARIRERRTGKPARPWLHERMRTPAAETTTDGRDRFERTNRQEKSAPGFRR